MSSLETCSYSRSKSISARRVSVDRAEIKFRSFLAKRGRSSRAANSIEKLPFFGPLDPPRWPLHKTLFLGGILFFPLWLIGAFLEVRATDDNCEFRACLAPLHD